MIATTIISSIKVKPLDVFIISTLSKSQIMKQHKKSYIEIL